MASVSLKNVYKIYDNQMTAVNDFNLEIEDKEFIIFVGPSGCGKSTTLRMIAGLEEISTGELVIGDKVVTDIEPKDRDIAMVFQNYALYPHMSVYDNMAFALKLRNVPKEEIDLKIKEAAKILDLEPYLHRKPKVFLMDEPLSNLDAKLRVQMRTEITKLHQTLGTTFIYVTHDQTEAMTMGTRIVVMNKGVIQQVDTPQNIYNYPQNKFVASFIGSPQMNFIDGDVIKEGSHIFIVVAKDKIHLPDQLGQKLLTLGYVGKKITLGIRPEDIKETASEQTESKIEGTIEMVELMGAESYIHVKYEDQIVIIRVNGTTEKKIGDQMTLYLNTERVHLFDVETERRI